MFSPIVATASVMAASTVLPPANRRLQHRFDLAVGLQRRLGDALRQRLELLVPRDEIGLRVELDHRRAARPSRRSPTRPSAATRPAFFAALARPLVRSQSTAASMSPLVSFSAVLQSIMPTPVFSRSSFTICAVMAIRLVLSIFLETSAP